MALGLLFLMLLKALTIHAQLEPLTNEITLQPNFQDTLFQGKWYNLAHGENWFPKRTLRRMNMFSTFFDLNHDHSFNVTTTVFSGEGCDHWTRKLIPSTTPGLFSLADMPHFFQLQRYTEQVVSTDYKEFAIMYRELDFTTAVKFIIVLYGRTTTVSSAVKDNFYKLVKAQGTPENNIIFYDHTEECIHN